MKSQWRFACQDIYWKPSSKPAKRKKANRGKARPIWYNKKYQEWEDDEDDEEEDDPYIPAVKKWRHDWREWHDWHGLGVHLIDRWRPGCLPRVSSRWCEKNARQLRVLWSWFFFIIVAADYADNTWSPNLIRVPPEAQSVERKLICHVWTRSPHTLLMGRWYLRRRSQWHWVGYIGAVSWHNGQWSMIEGGLVVIKVKRKLRALSFQSIDFKT